MPLLNCGGIVEWSAPTPIPASLSSSSTRKPSLEQALGLYRASTPSLQSDRDPSDVGAWRLASNTNDAWGTVPGEVSALNPTSISLAPPRDARDKLVFNRVSLGRNRPAPSATATEVRSMLSAQDRFSSARSASTRSWCDGSVADTFGTSDSLKPVTPSATLSSLFRLTGVLAWRTITDTGSCVGWFWVRDMANRSPRSASLHDSSR